MHTKHIKINWIGYVAFSLISLLVWFKFSYPFLSFVDLSINRTQALNIAQNYLAKDKGIDLSNYKSAVIFAADNKSDRYLQKAFGFEDEIAFIKKYDLDLFFWLVRFYQEGKKEEYNLTINSATGEIIAFRHILPNTDPRPHISEAEAKAKAQQFLKNRFNFSPEQYTSHSNLTKEHDNRKDFAFTWRKNDVYIPWNDQPDSGGAKLLIAATVSGDEVLSFSKNDLEIPEKFSRFIQRKKEVGHNLSILFSILHTVLLTAATFFVVLRRNHLAMYVSRNFCIFLTTTLFIFSIITNINRFENVLFYYPTTSVFTSYLGRFIISLLFGTFFVTISILMPSLAGESLHYEVFQGNKEGRFLHYITSTVLSRNMFRSIILGYLAGIILIGIQAGAFKFGQKYLGVWVEHSWMTQLTSAYFPFIAAFTISIRSSFIEEISFRLFGISWGKKILKNTFWACFIFSIFWGLGHSSYQIFPMWFRVIEVSCLGFFLSFTYIRYGIIPVIVGHYLLNAFWCSAGYLLGKSNPFDFYTSLGVILAPLFFGLIAFMANRPEVNKPMRWRLNKHQIYNLEILKCVIKDNESFKHKSSKELKKELLSHGWDIGVVEAALEDIRND